MNEFRNFRATELQCTQLSGKDEWIVFHLINKIIKNKFSRRPKKLNNKWPVTYGKSQ